MVVEKKLVAVKMGEAATHRFLTEVETFFRSPPKFERTPCIAESITFQSVLDRKVKIHR